MPAPIAFGLFFLLIGLKTDQNIRNELILVQRWGLLAIVVGLVMAGRFLVVAYVAARISPRARPPQAQGAASVVQRGEQSGIFWKHWSQDRRRAALDPSIPVAHRRSRWSASRAR